MREKLIDERLDLTDAICYAMRDWDDYIDECRETETHPVDSIEDFIADGVLSAGYRKQKWIPVSERLPDTIPCGAGTEYSEAVNVLTDGRKVLTAIWNGLYWICDAEFWDAEFEEITHWTPVLLPLPDPPKEEK